MLGTYSAEEYEELDKKVKDLESAKLKTAKFYEDRLLKLQKENEQMKLSKLDNPG